MNIRTLVEPKANPNIPDIAPGDRVKVRAKVIEGDKERIQAFEGTVIKTRRGISPSFTVRRVTFGIGVERTFPLQSSMVESVQVIRHGKVRRAKLYYLRQLSSKASQLKERRRDKKPG